MKLDIYKDHETASQHAAALIIDLVKTKQDAVLCLATGDTPRLTYQLVVQKAAAENINFSQCRFVGLDEWVGIPPQSEGSCHYFLYEHVFNPLQIPAENIYLFDGLSTGLQNECTKMNQQITSLGGINLMLAGVGMNGHIGFNEPGAPVEQLAHVIELDVITQTVGQKYFNQSAKLKQGITLGLQHFLDSRQAIVMATGSKKATIIQQVLEAAITTDVPASIVRKHPNSHVIIDAQAASLLNDALKI